MSARILFSAAACLSRLQHATEPDRDLPVERICFGQKPVLIYIDINLVIIDEFKPPGLAVVRVRREDRIG